MKRFFLLLLAAFVAVGALFASGNVFFQATNEVMWIPSNTSGADPEMQDWSGISASVKLMDTTFYPVVSFSGGVGFVNNELKWPWAKAGIGLGAFTDPILWSVTFQCGLVDFDTELAGYISAPVKVSFGTIKLFGDAGIILPFVDKSKSFSTKDGQAYTGFWIEPGIGLQVKNRMEFGFQASYGKTNQVINGDLRPTGSLECYQWWTPNFGTFISVKADGWHLNSDGKEKWMPHVGASVRF